MGKEHPFFFGLPSTWIDLLPMTTTMFLLLLSLFVLGRIGQSLAFSSSSRNKHKRSNASTNKKSSNARAAANIQLPALERCLQESLAQNDVILLVDANNVRGKTNAQFEWTMVELLLRLSHWQRSRTAPIIDHADTTTTSSTTTTTTITSSTSDSSKAIQNNLEIVCVLDHGCQSQSLVYANDLLMVFAGPQQTADDVLAVASRWLTTTISPAADNTSIDESSPSKSTVNNNNNDNNHVFVITSDRELRQRCLRNNRPGNFKKKQKQKDFVKVFDSASFVRTLQQHEEVGECNMAEKKSMQFERSVRNDSSNNDRTRSLADTTGFDEKTWHRVLFAEFLRRSLQSHHPPSSSPWTLSNRMRAYRHKFQQHAIEKRDRNTQAENRLTSMFLDHRIEYESQQQQHLLNYLEHAVGGNVPAKSEETAHSSKDPRKTRSDMRRFRNSKKGDEELLEKGRKAEIQWLAQAFGRPIQ